MVIDAGHHIEKIMIQGVAAFFRDFLNTNGYTGTTVMESTTNTNPFHLVIPHEVNQ
jgi:putative NIF3 family GTP cyclohydrolase 1 type 2